MQYIQANEGSREVFNLRVVISPGTAEFHDSGVLERLATAEHVALQYKSGGFVVVFLPGGAQNDRGHFREKNAVK